MINRQNLILIFLLFIYQNVGHTAIIDKGWFIFHAPPYYSIEDNQTSTILVLGPTDSSAMPNPFIGVEYQKMAPVQNDKEINKERCKTQRDYFFSLAKKNGEVKSETLPNKIIKFTVAQILLPNSKAERVFFCGKNFTLSVFAVYDISNENSNTDFRNLIESFEFK